MYYTTAHYTLLHYTAVHHTMLLYTTPCCTTLNCTTLHYITPHHITLHYTTPHHTTLHYTTCTLHYTTLHYTTLHCTTHTLYHKFASCFCTMAVVFQTYQAYTSTQVVPLLPLSSEKSIKSCPYQICNFWLRDKDNGLERLRKTSSVELWVVPLRG